MNEENMNEKNTPIPTWFWVAAILALFWNLMGVNAYIGQVTLTPEALAAMTQPQQELYNTTPAWVNGAFALSVFGGAIGSLLMLMKNAFASIAFKISLIGIAAQMGHAFFISNAFEVFGPGIFIMPVMIIVTGILLLWFAKSSADKGWIR